MKLGENLKRIRIERGIEKSRLAEVLNIDERVLDEYENDIAGPQVSDLLKLANVLGSDVAALISGKEFKEKRAIVTRSDARLHAERAKSLRYESLAPYYSGKHMEPFLVEVRQQATDQLDYSRHVGEEFHVVIEGTLRIVVDREEFVLEKGDSIYFDSALPHAVSAATHTAKILAVIYNGETMLQLVRGRRMRDMIQAAKMTEDIDIALVCPDRTAVEAVNAGIEEGVIRNVCFFGDTREVPMDIRRYPQHYHFMDIKESTKSYQEKAIFAALAAIREHRCHVLMKGNINTADLMRGLLDRERGIHSKRRLSLVSIFELPNVDRFVFLTDPGINPSLRPLNNETVSVDIIKNAIDVAYSMGVSVPKVALLDANEIPSRSVPSSIHAKKLAQMSWHDALVYGPISYDLALYEKAALKKGLEQNPVAGKADILVVPDISGGNFLYKAWAMTLAAEVANVVIGAEVPIILTSRSDTKMVKFLTICASVVYSQYSRRSQE